ncbi:MAG: TonB-dependent receptor [Verrucomicrobiota bacterium]
MKSFVCFSFFAAGVLGAQEPATKLDEMVITANRDGQTLFEQLQPASLLTAEELRYEIAPTLGETLAREPGVSSTSFGPGAGRPIIRGLGDDRVRILQNGTSVFDVSNVSPDHAVAVDPLSIGSVEILRGPASLLYGPNTTGGVVNVIDGRIPLEKHDGKFPTGRVLTEAGSADDSFSSAGAFDWGAGPFAFHIDGFHRETDDIEIPGYARSSRLRAADPLPPGETEAKGTLPNSATQSTGAAFGGTWFFEKGHLGASFSGIDSSYGTVAEPDVTIDLRQRRFDLSGALLEPFAYAKEVNFKLGWTDYEHTEFEGPDPGTEFLTDGINLRTELVHEEIVGFEGALGYEYRGSDFSALGSEAFLPSVESTAHSLFLFEESKLNEKLRLQLSGRYDNQSHETSVDEADFHVFGASAGIVYNPAENYALTLSLSGTRRPPTYVELYADGPHVATGTVEIGDPSLGTEDVLALDLSVKKSAGFVTGGVSGFYYRFDDFISLQPTGMMDPVENLPVSAYRAVAADFIGAEAEAVFHLLDPVATEGKPATRSTTLDFTLAADYVHAEDRDTGEPLPLIPPLRTRAALDYRIGPMSARMEGMIAAAHDRNADDELRTSGYQLINASLGYDFEIGGVKTTAYVKGSNLTNEEVRYSTSALKDVAPLAGRGVVVGLTAEF